MEKFISLIGSIDAATGAAQHSVGVGYIPISLSCLGICIALAAFSVAYRNFRLSRFPHVRVKFKAYKHTLPPPSQTEENLFEVEVTSWGLPIYDMRVFLEANYRGPDYCDQLGKYYIELQPLGTLPNPMAPGQVAKFATSEEIVKDVQFPRKHGLSDLPFERLCLKILGSGGLPIATISSKTFPFGFMSFDSLNGKPTARKGERVDRFDIGSKWFKTIKGKPNPFKD